MPDDLIISGGGSTAVATDELYANAQMLARLARESAAMRSQVAAIDAAVGPGSWHGSLAGAPASAALAERDLDDLAQALDRVHLQAQLLQYSLVTVAEGYGLAERLADALVTGIASSAGSLVGRLLPGLLVSTAGGAIVLGTAAALVIGGRNLGELVGRDRGVSRGSSFARNNNGIVTNAATVSLIRAAATAVGGGALGALGLPPGLASAAPGALPFAARTIMAAGSRLGLLDETSVRLHSSHGVQAVAPPSGYAERLARVPGHSWSGGAQVVIERYSSASGPDRFEVYVSGTADFSPAAGPEPWDMTSNLANTAGPGSGSYDSVVEAMRLAGVEKDSPVQFTGYSQGGGTVARLAASGEFNTQGVLAFGGPTGQVPIPASVPAVLVEHMDDPVPALGGMQANHHALVVERDVFGGRDIPNQYAVPSHHREYYVQTAELMDEARSDQVRDGIEQLDRFTDGATLRSSRAYRFERVSETSTP